MELIAIPIAKLKTTLSNKKIKIKTTSKAAKGREFLHSKVNPLVIYRDLKCPHILLGEWLL